MVHKDIIEKRKAKQAKKGIAENPPRLASNDKTSNSKGDIATKPKKPRVAPAIEPSIEPPTRQQVSLQEDKENPLAPVAPHDFKLLESIEFEFGKNKLSLQFLAKNNRQRCIKVYLNDTHEIRPVTYNGTGTGHAFWQLLKGALIK